MYPYKYKGSTTFSSVRGSSFTRDPSSLSWADHPGTSSWAWKNPFFNSRNQEWGKYGHSTLLFSFNKSTLIRQSLLFRIRLHHHQAFRSLWMI
jgi:hypothetical protein